MSNTDCFRAIPSSMAEIGAIEVKAFMYAESTINKVEMRVSAYVLYANKLCIQKYLFPFLGASRYGRTRKLSVWEHTPVDFGCTDFDWRGRVTLQLVVLCYHYLYIFPLCNRINLMPLW